MRDHNYSRELNKLQLLAMSENVQVIRKFKFLAKLTRHDLEENITLRKLYVASFKKITDLPDSIEHDHKIQKIHQTLHRKLKNSVLQKKFTHIADPFEADCKIK